MADKLHEVQLALFSHINGYKDEPIKNTFVSRTYSRIRERLYLVVKLSCDLYNGH